MDEAARRSPRLLVFLLVAAGVSTALLLWRASVSGAGDAGRAQGSMVGRQVETGDGTPRAKVPHLESGEAGQEARAPALEGPHEVPGEPTAAQARAPVPLGPWEAVVRDERGGAVDGADATWIALIDDDFGPKNTWGSIDWSLVEAATVRATTDSQGRLRFDAPPNRHDALGSVLWIHRAGFMALPVLLEPASHELPQHAFVLQAAAPYRVRVTEPDGRPSEGATIEMLGIRTEAPGEDGDRWLRAYRLFRRTWASSASEPVLAAPLPGRQGFFASRGDVEALPQFSTGTEEAGKVVELDLRGCFTAGGTVTREDGARDVRGLLRVACSASVDCWDWYLKQVSVSPSGSWGPMRLPVVDEARTYTFELRAPDCVPVQSSILPPRPGERRTIDFTLSRGATLEVLVQDGDAVPIQGAGVMAYWPASDSGSVNLPATTDAEGRAVISGCLRGTVHLYVTADGFVSRIAGPFDLGQEGDASFVVGLERAGRIVGRVLHHGRPVEDFEVKFWLEFNPWSNLGRRSFTGRTDGSFEIDEAPLGVVGLFASSSDLPRSDGAVVNVVPGEAAEAVLELPDPIVGRGRVVDLLTGEPLAGAHVSIMMNFRDQHLGAWGGPSATDEDGVFELSGFSPGDTRFTVEAQGYGRYTGRAWGVEGRDLDLGILPLARLQPMTVRLHSGLAEDLSGFRVSATGASVLPLISFSSEGVARYEGVAPGHYYLEVESAQSADHATVEVDLDPGSDGLVDVPLDGGRSIEIQVVPPAGRTLEDVDADGVFACFASSSGSAVRRAGTLDDEGLVEFPASGGSSALVEVVDSSNASLGVQALTLSSDVRRYRIQLGTTESVRLRVVDGNGTPLPGTLITASLPETFPGWSRRFDADQDGEARIPRDDGLVMRLEHPRAGDRAGARLADAERKDGAYEVAIADGAILDFELRDPGGPARGVRLTISDSRSGQRLATVASDGDGRCSFGSVSPGDYQATIAHPGLWPVRRLVHVTHGASPPTVRMDVHRVGDLILELQDQNGVPVPEASIDLVWTTSGEHVEAWIADGRVASSSGAAATDADGRLELRGLPEGPYLWRLCSDSGSVGGLQVEAGEADLSVLVVP